MLKNNVVEASIGENFFAPKCKDRNENFDINNAHAIANIKCNFKCAFCKNGLDLNQKPEYMTFEEFDRKIEYLLNKGRMFKFTGGEPCMNPNIKKMVKKVKEKGGMVFFDTNASIKKVILNLLDENLIDVLGISLKGLTPEKAMKTAGINNKELCWDNPLFVIKEASNKKNVRLIVTYVAYDDFKYEDLYEFSKILENLGDNIYLKINNLCGEIHRDNTIKPIKKEKIEKIINDFVEKNNQWKNRIILITSSKGVTDYSNIIFK